MCVPCCGVQLTQPQHRQVKPLARNLPRRPPPNSKKLRRIHQLARGDGLHLRGGGRGRRDPVPHRGALVAAARGAVRPSAKPLSGAAPRLKAVVRRRVRRLPHGQPAGLLPRPRLARTSLPLAGRRRHPLRRPHAPPLGCHCLPCPGRRHRHFLGNSSLFPALQI